MTKANSPYDYDTNDMAAEIAREIDIDHRYKGGLSRTELVALIEKKLDSMVQDGKLKVFEKRHHASDARE